MKVTVTNLKTLATQDFGDVPPVQAVCTAYALDNNLGPWFFQMLHNKLRYVDALPVTIGRLTVACGDFTALKEPTP